VAHLPLELQRSEFAGCGIGVHTDSSVSCALQFAADGHDGSSHHSSARRRLQLGAYAYEYVCSIPVKPVDDTDTTTTSSAVRRALEVARPTGAREPVTGLFEGSAVVISSFEDVTRRGSSCKGPK